MNELDSQTLNASFLVGLRGTYEPFRGMVRALCAVKYASVADRDRQKCFGLLFMHWRSRKTPISSTDSLRERESCVLS